MIVTLHNITKVNWHILLYRSIICDCNDIKQLILTNKTKSRIISHLPLILFYSQAWSLSSDKQKDTCYRNWSLSRNVKKYFRQLFPTYDTNIHLYQQNSVWILKFHPFVTKLRLCEVNDFQICPLLSSHLDCILPNFSIMLPIKDDCIFIISWNLRNNVLSKYLCNLSYAKIWSPIYGIRIS